jgi:hypothetical protein
MSRFYAMQIKLGKITIEKVPEKYKKAVEKILEEENEVT